MRLWKQTTGVAFRNNLAISFGLRGSADISGIALGGIRVEIECKTGNAKQTKQQRAYQVMIEGMGGIYILARDVEVACDQLQKVLRLRGIEVSF